MTLLGPRDALILKNANVSFVEFAVLIRPPGPGVVSPRWIWAEGGVDGALFGEGWPRGSMDPPAPYIASSPPASFH